VYPCTGICGSRGGGGGEGGGQIGTPHPCLGHGSGSLRMGSGCFRGVAISLMEDHVVFLPGSVVLQAVVCGDEVSCGKPAPDCFLKVAAEMGVRPAECLVVEDAPAGRSLSFSPRNSALVSTFARRRLEVLRALNLIHQRKPRQDQILKVAYLNRAVGVR